jgi:hypothetical protein
MDKKLYAFTLDDREYARVVKVLKQTGKKPNLVIDKARRAMMPGKRISKTGNTYWESRFNRSDKSPSKKL